MHEETQRYFYTFIVDFWNVKIDYEENGTQVVVYRYQKVKTCQS